SSKKKMPPKVVKLSDCASRSDDLPTITPGRISPIASKQIHLFINKAWGYGDPKPDHYFLALNYRMCELQGAVALAQLEKLPEIVRNRQTLADRATEKLQGMDGVTPPTLTPGGSHVYWKYCLSVDRDNVPDATVQLGGLLRDRGIMCAPRYIQKPAFCCEVIAHQRTFGDSRWPFTLARPEVLDYSKERFPGTYEALARVMVLPWNEKYSNEDVDYVVEAVQDAVSELK
ncbi:MAG: DegT/DnrJ/EryC1/StrS family aminotransferase, partial [Verrucomicrobiota bacterium]